MSLIKQRTKSPFSMQSVLRWLKILSPLLLFFTAQAFGQDELDFAIEEEDSEEIVRSSESYLQLYLLIASVIYIAAWVFVLLIPRLRQAWPIMIIFGIFMYLAGPWYIKMKERNSDTFDDIENTSISRPSDGTLATTMPLHAFIVS